MEQYIEKSYLHIYDFKPILYIESYAEDNFPCLYSYIPRVTGLKTIYCE